MFCLATRFTKLIFYIINPNSKQKVYQTTLLLQEFQEGRYLAWNQDLCLLHHTGRLDPEQGGIFNRPKREFWGSFPQVKVGKISCNFLKIKVRILTSGKRIESLTQLGTAFSSLVLLKQLHHMYEALRPGPELAAGATPVRRLKTHFRSLPGH